jgi:hypothetical protein
MGEYITVAQAALQALFVITVAFKTVEGLLDIQRKRLEVKREQQKLDKE